MDYQDLEEQDITEPALTQEDIDDLLEVESEQ